MKWAMRWMLLLLITALTGCVSSAPKSGTPREKGSHADTQVYTGSLPCKYCSRIETHLVLNGLYDRDEKAHRFTLEANYIEREERIGGRRYAGTWHKFQGTPVAPSVAVFSLTDQTPGAPITIHLQQINAQTLEFLDGQRQRYENGRGLRLYLNAGDKIPPR